MYKIDCASFRSVRRRGVCCGPEQRHSSVPTLLSSRSGSILTMRASVCPSDVLEKARLTFSRRAQRGSCSPDREREGSVCELRVSLVYFRRYRQRRAPRSEDTLSHTRTRTHRVPLILYTFCTHSMYISMRLMNPVRFIFMRIAICMCACLSAVRGPRLQKKQRRPKKLLQKQPVFIWGG